MIVLNVQSPDIKVLEEAAEILLHQHLAIDVNIASGVNRHTLEDGNVVVRPHCVLRARTKALLFPLIDRRLRERFAGDNMPEVFSVPIVNMDWDQIVQLRNDIEDV